jgi:tetratricopeptide (TPR) repeat protein
MPHNVLKHARSLRLLGNYREAALIVKNCLATCDTSDHEAKGALIQLLGQLERDQDKPAEAIEHYKSAYTIFHAAGFDGHAIHALRHIADIETDLGILEEAERNFAKVLAYYGKTGSTPALDHANALRGHALLCEKRHDPSTARESWEKAMSLYKREGFKDGIEECEEHLAAL